MIGRRALGLVEFRGYVPRYVLDCARCHAFAHSRTRAELVAAAMAEGWAPSEDLDGRFLCPEHAAEDTETTAG